MKKEVVGTFARRTVTLMLATVAALLAFPDAAVAQEGMTTGSIGGVVRDADGAPLADAVVRVRSVDRGTERETLTGENGRFRVGLLQPGDYIVQAELPPLRPVEAGPVTVGLGERTSVNLTLQPVEAEELRVEVGGLDPTRIDAAQGGVVELVDEEQVSELPTAGRDFTDFIGLSGLVSPTGAPSVRQETGTGGQFAILGSRTSTSNITVDGVDANNQFFGENRGGSRLPFTFSLESVKEFQVITSGYDVEHGRFAGGQINAVTRGGTNELDGEAWFFWRDEALTAENFDGTPASNFKSLQFGGRLSGPIIEDELHFFVSGDFQERDEPAFALDPTRAGVDPAAIDEIKSIMRDVYGFDQQTIDESFGIFDTTDDQFNVFGRVDWSINPDHRLTVRSNISNFESLNDELSVSGRDARLGGSTFEADNYSVVAELNSQLSSNVFNTFRFQWAKEDRPRAPNSNIPELNISDVPTVDDDGDVTGTTTVDVGGNDDGISFANRLQERKFQVVNNLNVNLGDHTLKIGTDNVFAKATNKFWLFGNGAWDFVNIDDFRDQNPDFFLRAVPDLDDPSAPVGEFSQNNLSVYVQDEWQASDRLRLLGGLRWDFQDFKDPALPLEDPDFQDDLPEFGADITALPDDKNNFGPRFSFTYDLAGDESQLVRGGVGVFYDDIPFVTHGNVKTNNPEPLLFNVCIAAAAPDPSRVAEMDDDPDLIPNSCAFEGFQAPPFGIGIIGSPDVVVWDEDIDNPKTLRANLGYETRIADRWKVGVRGLFSRTWDLFRGRQLTQADEPFFRQGDGRPVWVEEGDWDPEDTSEDDVTQADDLRFLFEQTDGADARAFSLTADVQGAPTDELRFGASYTLNVAKDNSTKECCTAFALTTEVPTAGNMNFLGGPGDEDVGSWGSSRNERRHVVVLNGIWRLPAGFQVSAIYRGQAGLPYTPRVFGDLNGDGVDDNDRPFLPDPSTAAGGDPLNLDGLQFASMEELNRYQNLLSQHECLREAVGSIVNRNTCNDPWWHSVDIKLKKRFQVTEGQAFEVTADFFNVLDGLGLGAGEFVFERNTLFIVPEAGEGNLNAENEVIVETAGDFGEEVPAGFSPFQFQAQLGVRYHF